MKNLCKFIFIGITAALGNLVKFTPNNMWCNLFIEKMQVYTLHFTFTKKLFNRCSLVNFLIITHSWLTLREKCPYLKFFWSLFSRIRTEYGEIQSIQSECGETRSRKSPNTNSFQAINISILYSLNPLVSDVH